jgi:hypothetical protein
MRLKWQKNYSATRDVDHPFRVPLGAHGASPINGGKSSGENTENLNLILRNNPGLYSEYINN